MTFLDQMPDIRLAARLKVAAVSVKQGSQKGIALLSSLPQADRELALEMAVEHLSAGRHYKLFVEFVDATNSDSSDGFVDQDRRERSRGNCPHAKGRISPIQIPPGRNRDF
jgi:hypothetical protein